jgi:hypothetical protein
MPSVKFLVSISVIIGIIVVVGVGLSISSRPGINEKPNSLLYLYPFAVGFVVVISNRKEVQTFWSQDRKENIK